MKYGLFFTHCRRAAILVLVTMGCLQSARAAEWNLMPWPDRIDRNQGFLVLNPSLSLRISGSDGRVHRGADDFVRRLEAQTGVPFRSRPAVSSATAIVIRCANSGAKVQSVGEDESYRLSVDGEGILLTAPNPLGILHGLQTLSQLVQQNGEGWAIPQVVIDDRPRFPWRGLMIDVSRHFMPIEILKRNIDGMAAVKLNTLHLHLSDDEGFRVESRRFPKLQQLASDGLFYTQSQIRDLIAYARDRGIRIVPEFDMPAHAVSWLVAYPKLGGVPGPFDLIRVMKTHDRQPIDPTRESTYQLLDRFFGEMTALFPDAYFHIGGDEVNKRYWQDNERIQVWMRVHHVKDSRALQGYFTGRLQKLLAKRGKHMEGWDEILDSSLPKDTLIQSWRGPKQLAAASQMGYRSILSAGWYLDLMHPASQHYAVEPFSGDSASLDDAGKRRILGGEAAQWAEYITPENIDNRIWPRLGAIAERLWSPANVQDVNSMYARLEALSRELEWIGLRHRADSHRMLERLAGSGPVEPFELLAAAVEPVKDYEREKQQAYGGDTPLNRLVDAIPPESATAWEFSLMTQRVAREADVRKQVRAQLTEWKQNDAVLQPLLASSFLLKELVPVSKSVSNVAAIGLEALDIIDAGQPVSSDRQAEQLAEIDRIAMPQAELLIAIAPAIRILVQSEPLAVDSPRAPVSSAGEK